MAVGFVEGRGVRVDDDFPDELWVDGRKQMSPELVSNRLMMSHPVQDRARSPLLADQEGRPSC